MVYEFIVVSEEEINYVCMIGIIRDHDNYYYVRGRVRRCVCSGECVHANLFLFFSINAPRVDHD